MDKKLEKDTVVIIQDRMPAFYSSLFPVEKASGGWRLVIDLLPLSTFLALSKFRMGIVA